MTPPRTMPPYKLQLQHDRKNVLHRNPRAEACHVAEDCMTLDQPSGLEVIKNQTARYCEFCFPLAGIL